MSKFIISNTKMDRWYHSRREDRPRLVGAKRCPSHLPHFLAVRYGITIVPLTTRYGDHLHTLLAVSQHCIYNLLRSLTKRYWQKNSVDHHGLYCKYAIRSNTTNCLIYICIRKPSEKIKLLEKRKKVASGLRILSKDTTFRVPKYNNVYCRRIWTNITPKYWIS